MNMYFVEQDVTQLKGTYLTEALILAESGEAAAAATEALEAAFGILASADRFRIIDLGKAPKALLKVFPRHVHKTARVLIVGEGEDY